MNAEPVRRLEVREDAGVRAPPRAHAGNGVMNFRIMGPHQHRAMWGDRVFWCERETTTTEGRLTSRWSAFEGKILLQRDCPTLNDAKRLCRAAASEDPRAAD